MNEHTVRSILADLARIDRNVERVNAIIPTSQNWQTVRAVSLARLWAERRAAERLLAKLVEAEREAAEMNDADRFDFALQ